MSKLIRSRASNGRYRKATVENTFGLKAWICEDCRTFNPVQVGEDKPKNCHACGSEKLI